LIALVLAACASNAPEVFVLVEREPVDSIFETSFDCREIGAHWQAFACRDPELAGADRRLHEAYIRQLTVQDRAGRGEVLASQRHWQIGLGGRCGIAGWPAKGSALPAAPLACLRRAWQQRTDRLESLPAPVPQPQGGAPSSHPLAAYVVFRESQSLEPDLCREAAQRINGLISNEGDMNPGHAPGWRLLAGSHGQAAAELEDGRQVEVRQHEPGVYAGYERRATGVWVDGTQLIDDRTLPAWTLELPNGDGGFSSMSSQTRDYAWIDVLAQDRRVLALVVQTWGYYVSAARGESPHAALYELAAGHLQRRCLWRTYTAPPVARMTERLPQFRALQDTLDLAAGPDSPNLAPDDRRDAALLYNESVWSLLNMPLVVIDEVRRYGRWAMLHQRNDEALDAVFAWSERNVPCKQLYRRLMPLISAAHAELAHNFEAGDGLKPDDARQASDLLIIVALARAAERLQEPAWTPPEIVGASYKPRYAAAPKPGDLERGRAYGGLHSAVLNRASADVIDEWLSASRGKQPGAAIDSVTDGDTPLMAAVRSPDLLGRLIDAGADVNGRNAWGKTALMLAAQANQPDSVQRLLAAGADSQARTIPWHRDGAGGLDNAEGSVPGHTALRYAAASARRELIETLWTLGGAAGLPVGGDAGPAVCLLLKDNPHLNAEDRAQLRTWICPKAKSAKEK
jgi:uncharacterized protein YecT (DUF1311 family)